MREQAAQEGLRVGAVARLAGITPGLAQYVHDAIVANASRQDVSQQRA